MLPPTRKTSSEELDPISIPYKTFSHENHFESEFERARPVEPKAELMKQDLGVPQYGDAHKTKKLNPMEFRCDVWQENLKGLPTEPMAGDDPDTPTSSATIQTTLINDRPDSPNDPPIVELKSIKSIDSVGTRSSVESSSSSLVKGVRRGLLDIRILDIPTKLNKAVKRTNSSDSPSRKRIAIERPGAVKNATSPAVQTFPVMNQEALLSKGALETQKASSNSDATLVKTARSSPTNTPSRRQSLMSHVVRAMSDGTVKRGSVDTQKSRLKRASTDEIEPPFIDPVSAIDDHETNMAHSPCPWTSPVLTPGPQLGVPGLSLTPISEGSRSRQDLTLSSESLGKIKPKNSRETVSGAENSIYDTSGEVRPSSRQGQSDKETPVEQTRKLKLDPRRWFARSASRNSDQSASGGKTSLKSESRWSSDDHDPQSADKTWNNKIPIVIGTTTGPKNTAGGESRISPLQTDTSELKNPRKDAILNSESMFQRPISDPLLYPPSQTIDESSIPGSPLISSSRTGSPAQGLKSDRSKYPGPLGYLMPSRRNSHGSASLLRPAEARKPDTPGLFEQNVTIKPKGPSYYFDYRPRKAAADTGGRWDSDTLLMSQAEVHKAKPEPIAVAESEKPSHGQEWFRVRVVDEDGDSPWTRPDWNVPEHLPGSPLCPLSPKNKSRGYGVCVYHGRRKTLGAGKSEW